MRRSFISPAALVSCALLLISTSAHAADISTEHKLSCGHTNFVIESRQSLENGLKHQVMYAHPFGRDTIKPDLEINYVDSNEYRMSGSKPVALIEEWKCLRTEKGKFVELLFACNEDIGDLNIDRYCGGSAMEEWTRYLGLDGKLLDAGYKIGDQRYKRLWKRLGLPNLADGETRAEVMIPVD